MVKNRNICKINDLHSLQRTISKTEIGIDSKSHLYLFLRREDDPDLCDYNTIVNKVVKTPKEVTTL